MKCIYCNPELTSFLLTREVVEQNLFKVIGEGTITGYEALQHKEDLFVFINEGYLRMVGFDYSCMDHGEKIKINFCPMCGKKVTE